MKMEDVPPSYFQTFLPAGRNFLQQIGAWDFYQRHAGGITPKWLNASQVEKLIEKAERIKNRDEEFQAILDYLKKYQRCTRCLAIRFE